jgi:hypothetical protein
MFDDAFAMMTAGTTLAVEARMGWLAASTRCRAPARASRVAGAPHVTCVRAIVIVFALLAGWAVSPVLACPNCAVGREARSEVWDDQFARNLAYALLPFVVIGLVSLQVDAIGRRDRTSAIQPGTSRGLT